MPTIPTGRLEAELRKLYLQWVSGLNFDDQDIHKAMASFSKRSQALIEKMGGDVARLGALADFPAPKELDLSLHAGTVYNQMQLATVQARITAGLNSRTAAQAMFRAGMDKSYRRLERLARTETVSAYWKNAWDSISSLPALVMVWGAENGPRTCQWCKERDGMVLDGPDIRDHPNGRCTPIPTLRSEVHYKGSVRSDGEIYSDPAWEAQPDPKFPSQPVESVPLAASTSEGQFDSRVVWPKAGERDLPFSALLDSEEHRIESALNRYLSGGYQTINDALRRGLKTDATLTDQINILKKVTSEVTTKDLTLNRGMGSVDFLGAKFRKPDFDPATLVGKSFTDKGFVSTSHAGDIPLVDFDSMPVQMEIMAPKGTHGSLMGNTEEREFVLAPGSTFTIVDAVRSAEGKLRLRVVLTQKGMK
jgi:hypothetical protein